MSHRHALRTSAQGRDIVHGTSGAGPFNQRIAAMITRGVGSMWCAYAFAILALVSLPAAIQTRQPIIIVGWVAQTFLQLVLLPVIIVGQNVQAAASDARAEADHETLQAIHALTVAIHDLDEAHSRILARLDAADAARK